MEGTYQDECDDRRKDGKADDTSSDTADDGSCT